MDVIDPSRAFDLLHARTALEDLHLSTLDLHTLGDPDVRLPVTARACRIDALDASFLVFEEPVTFEQCHFGSLFCFATYFLRGARFINCTFDGAVTFECGGHNEAPAAFVLVGCIFHQFVNFFDGWYPGPVEVRGCRFEAGTNLLGNIGQPFVTSFEVSPIIADTSGVLDLDGG